MKIELNIDNETDFTEVPSADDFQKWVDLSLESRVKVNCSLNIIIVNEEEITHLNETYRQKPGSTNVLAFPYADDELMDVEGDILGEIIICAPVVEREAQEQNKKSFDHWAHMTIHSCLHLVGYDHIDDKDADEMESLEIELLKALGIANPYEES